MSGAEGKRSCSDANACEYTDASRTQQDNEQTTHCLKPRSDDIETALASLPADELRQVVHDVLRELDSQSYTRVVQSLLVRAARGNSGWVPAAVSDSDIAEAMSFAKAAKRVGYADPADVDEHLRRGSSAFLRKDYAAARQIFAALLTPIAHAEIDLGECELVTEVLGVDVAECAAQYVVSVYMITPFGHRAEAVRAALEEVRQLGYFWEPLRVLENVAREPLPDFDAFLPYWHELLAAKPAAIRQYDWDAEEDRWLREATLRLKGTEGLAVTARATRRAEDLRAWCKALADAGNWQPALAAFAEAATLIPNDEYTQGDLLEGAALAAQQLVLADLPQRLEAAWRAHATMARLCRWLGTANSKASLRKRAVTALDGLLKSANRQRALLHVLVADFESAAKLLASAPGLGWSHENHPGHLLFPLFTSLLGHPQPLPAIEELSATLVHANQPRLITPDIDQLLQRAEIRSVERADRVVLLAALRKAAEKRLAGVTKNKRRSYYGHAALLVATYLACDPSPHSAAWVATLRSHYRRLPALQTEFDRALGIR